MCHVSLTVMLCVTWGFRHFEQLSSLSLFSPPSQDIWRAFLFLYLLSLSLFSTTTGLEQPDSCHYYFYRSLTTRPRCVCSLFISPSLITTSSYQLAYLHCNINSKLYSMLSTCLSVSPISIPPIFSTSVSLPWFLTSGRITVRLRGEGGTRWPPTSQNCQTWCPPAVH